MTDAPVRGEPQPDVPAHQLAVRLHAWLEEQGYTVERSYDPWYPESDTRVVTPEGDRLGVQVWTPSFYGTE